MKISDDQGGSLLAKLDTRYHQFFQTVLTPTRYVSATILLSMIALLLYGIVAREVEAVLDFGVSELTTILAVWIVFLELPNLSYKNDQIKVDYFYLRSSDRTKYYMNVLHYGVIALGTLALFVSSLMVTSTYLTGRTSVIGLPRFVYSVPMIYGFGALLVIYWYQLLRLITGQDLRVDENGDDIDGF